jgi:hypothetical protein
VYVVTVEKRLLLKKLNDLMALRYVVCSDIWCFWIFYYAPWSNHHAGDRIKRGETSILSLWQTISSTSLWKADLALSSPAVLDAVLCKGTTSTTRITTDITGTTDTTSTGTITTTTIIIIITIITGPFRITTRPKGMWATEMGWTKTAIR